MVGPVEFLAYLRYQRKLAPNTIRAYESDLKLFYAFLWEHRSSLLHVTTPSITSFTSEFGSKESIFLFQTVEEKILRRFILLLGKQGYQRSSVNRIMTSIRQYYEYNATVDNSKKNPTINLSIPPSRSSPSTFLFFQEMQRILDAAKIPLRKRVLWEFLYSTGCRINEALQLNVGDLQGNRLWIQGKGGYKRCVFLNYLTQKKLITFLKERQACESDPLFVNARGSRLSARGANYWLKQHAQVLGITKKISNHTFRHTLASDLLNRGMDIRLVQAVLGHRQINTTQKYTHLQITKLKQVYHQSHPLGDPLSSLKGSVENR